MTENIIMLAQGTGETLYMTLASVLFSYLLGLPLGVLVVATGKQGICPHPKLNTALGWAIDIGRSIPFIILLIFLIPLTRAVVGSAIGVKGAILPLVFGTVPFYTRQVEVALAGVNEGKVEAARSMGSGTLGLIFRVYLHEAVPELIRVTTVTAISLIGLTTMAGAVGAGGIGASLVQCLNSRRWGMVGSFVWGLMVLVLIIELISTRIRRKLAHGA